MGIFVEKAAPPAEVIQEQISTALAEPQPRTDQEREQRAAQLAKPAAQAGKGVRINAINFAIAAVLFLTLLAVAIVVDWKNVVDDPSVYTGMATTVLGVIVGFLGGEASGSAS
jgi:hypothetical protein